MFYNACVMFIRDALVCMNSANEGRGSEEVRQNTENEDQVNVVGVALSMDQLQSFCAF